MALATVAGAKDSVRQAEDPLLWLCLIRSRRVGAVMVDEPTGGHYGGDVAGPVFSQIMGGALRTLGIPPDDPIKTAEAATGKGRL